MRGQVKWFSSAKGFGFAVPEDGGPDHYVHITDLDAEPQTGEWVEFESLETPRGPKAIRARVVR
jgi:CspA family cold shock protein